jgi:chromosome segregation ATPase
MKWLKWLMFWKRPPADLTALQEKLDKVTNQNKSLRGEVDTARKDARDANKLAKARLDEANTLRAQIEQMRRDAAAARQREKDAVEWPTEWEAAGLRVTILENRVADLEVIAEGYKKQRNELVAAALL